METDGTALGMKKHRSRMRLGADFRPRRARAAHVPLTSAAALAITPVSRLAFRASKESVRNAAP